MKKRLLILALSALLLLPLMACGKEEEEVQLPQIDYLGKMADANPNEELVEDYGRVGSETELTYADGSTGTLYRYIDSARYYEEGDAYWIIDEEDRYYTYDKETDQVLVSLFVGTAHDDKLAAEAVTGYRYRPEQEQYLSVEEAEGVVTLRTEITDQKLVEAAEEFLGYEPGDLKALRFTYEISAKSYRISATQVAAVLENGKEKPAARLEVVIRPEEFVPDEVIEERVFGEKLRSVNVVVDPMEETEEIYRFRPPQGTRVELVIPEEYDQKLYMDEACTEPFREQEGENHYDQNYVIFAKSEK